MLKRFFSKSVEAPQARPVASFGPDGTLYVTVSGTRGQKVPVSVFKVDRRGVKEPFLSDITNATSLAFDAGGVRGQLNGIIQVAQIIDKLRCLRLASRENTPVRQCLGFGQLH